MPIITSIRKFICIFFYSKLIGIFNFSIIINIFLILNYEKLFYLYFKNIIFICHWYDFLYDTLIFEFLYNDSLSNPFSWIFCESIVFSILSIIHFHHSHLRQLDSKDHAHLCACLHCDGKLRGLDAGFPAAGTSSNQLCWPKKSKGLRLLAVSLVFLLLSVSFVDGFHLIVAGSRMSFFFFPSFLHLSARLLYPCLSLFVPPFSALQHLYPPEQRQDSARRYGGTVKIGQWPKTSIFRFLHREEETGSEWKISADAKRSYK